MKFSRSIKAKVRRRMTGPTIQRNPDVPTTRRNPDDLITRTNPDWLELGVRASSSSIAGNLTRLNTLPDSATAAEGGEAIDKTPTIYVLPSHEAIIQNKYDCYWNAATDV